MCYWYRVIVIYPIWNVLLASYHCESPYLECAVDIVSLSPTGMWFWKNILNTIFYSSKYCENASISILSSVGNSIAHLNVSDRLNAKVVEMAKIT